MINQAKDDDASNIGGRQLGFTKQETIVFWIVFKFNKMTKKGDWIC
jgi:hypothetical protein